MCGGGGGTLTTAVNVNVINDDCISFLFRRITDLNVAQMVIKSLPRILKAASDLYASFIASSSLWLRQCRIASHSRPLFFRVVVTPNE